MIIFGLQHFKRVSLDRLKEEGFKNANPALNLVKELCIRTNGKNKAGNLCIAQVLEALPNIESGS